MISTGPEPGDISGLVVALVIGAGLLLVLGVAIFAVLLRVSRRSTGVAIAWGLWIYVCIPAAGLWLLLSEDHGDGAFPRVVAMGFLVTVFLLWISAAWCSGHPPSSQGPRP